jgi:putative phosphoesterase
MAAYKIVLMSDSHGAAANVARIMEKQPAADRYIFPGDGTGPGLIHDVTVFLKTHPEYEEKFSVLRGNCDAGVWLPKSLCIDVPHHRIFAAHGDRYSVDFGWEKMMLAARLNNCDIILHGHTHVRVTEQREGFYIMNPGSCARPRDGRPPSFSMMEILEDGSVFMTTADV